MAGDFTIEDSELSKYITDLGRVPRAIGTASSRWVRRMTSFTERNMKKFSRSKTERSTGKLSSSISSKFTLTSKYVEGTVFVPEGIKYQFADEYGIQKRFVIHGNPRMSFPTSSWKKARQASGSVAEPNRGYFIFTEVTRGRYRGRRYTERSFKLLKDYYSRNKERISEDIGTAILFAR